MNDHSWRGWWKMTFETTQTWIVVSLVGKFRLAYSAITKMCWNERRSGAAIGLNSALIAIVTDWLSDIKFGYCSTAWWLNQKYCCWEIEGSGNYMLGKKKGYTSQCCDTLMYTRWRLRVLDVLEPSTWSGTRCVYRQVDILRCIGREFVMITCEIESFGWCGK